VQREVVVLVPCEPCEVERDDEVNLALVRAAVRQQSLQFGPVCRLRALAFFLEALDDLEALAVAVLFAGPKLGRQAQVFSLLIWC